MLMRKPENPLGLVMATLRPFSQIPMQGAEAAQTQ